MSAGRDLAAIAAAAAFFLAGSCRPDPGPPAQTQSPAEQETMHQPSLPGGRLQILRRGRSVAVFKVEIARTIQEQAAGLMGRARLARDAGMVFVHDSPSIGSFYMKNTLIPLDLAFWDAERKLFQIVEMQPCKSDPCRLYRPERPYLGALEVNAGVLDKHGVNPGDEVLLTANAPSSISPGRT